MTGLFVVHVVSSLVHTGIDHLGVLSSSGLCDDPCRCVPGIVLIVVVYVTVVCIQSTWFWYR